MAVPIYIPANSEGVSFSLHTVHHLLFVYFFAMAILTGRRWYLIVIVISISLVISNVEHLFGEGNGTPLQYYCPENPMDGGAW